MPGIDELLSAIMGQTDTALNAPAAPWQQELLETVNPQKVKRQNIARALAKASTAMATTPGNFLQGVSAAAATGADSYLTGKDQAENDRVRVQQLLQMQQQKDQDRRLDLLMDALGVQRNVVKDQQDAESHKVGLDRERATTDYYKRRGVDDQTLSPAQIETNRRTVRREIQQEKTRLDGLIKSGDYTPEQAKAELESFAAGAYEYYKIPVNEPAPNRSPTAGGATDQNVSQSDLWTPQPGAQQPGSAEVMTPDQYESGMPQPPSAGGILPAPPGAVEFLRKNPQHRQQFDQKYGPGAAAAILGN